MTEAVKAFGRELATDGTGSVEGVAPDPGHAPGAGTAESPPDGRL